MLDCVEFFGIIAAFSFVQGGFSNLVKSLRSECINLLTEIEARLDFDDEMPPLDLNIILDKIHSISHEVKNALETANYDKFLQSGLQVIVSFPFLYGSFWDFLLL